MQTPPAQLLRALRREHGISQAQVAQQAHISVSHLSRVEAGDRPVTPAVVNGYEKALGIRLASTPPGIGGQATTLGGHRFGEDADDMKRRAFTAAIAAIAVGGPLGEPVHRALASLGAADIPAHVGAADVVQVEQAETMFTAWDLRFGGGLAREMAATQLRWATRLLRAQMTDPVRTRLHAAVASLAERAAWSTFDAGAHDEARTLFKLALYTATEADDADLRAHILSDIATQQLHLGDPDECVKIIRLAEGDDRLSVAVRFVLHGVKARALGAMGDAPGCARQIDMAEQAYTTITPTTTPVWMRGFLCDAHVQSVTGQAAYALAQATAGFSDDAHNRLTSAIAGFDQTRNRAIALCATRLATLHLHAGHTPEGTEAARTALAAVPGLRSARITMDLTTMRAAAQPDDDLRQLREEISAAVALAT
ncbi:MAG: helix-turn-helix protein [Actinomycetota bacterium]|nr:helix-turn-helix protein [Actinomycetota bacterium]